VTIVDWAHVVLPLGALIWGLYLVGRYSVDIDRWVRRWTVTSTPIQTSVVLLDRAARRIPDQSSNR
jgi:hypothetical protein